MRRLHQQRRTFVLFAVVLLVAVAGCGTSGGPVADDARLDPERAPVADEAATTSAPAPAPTAAESACVEAGWNRELFDAGGRTRTVLWSAPDDGWTEGAIVVLHGGGGKAEHFCTGDGLVAPQVAFSNLAVERGFAVFVLDSTVDEVTDAQGRECGKRFDFAVADRDNVDLPAVGHILSELIPAERPPDSSPRMFLTGLSTGGYMTIRAASHFDGMVTAFAPIAAGDPYATEPICDPSTSARESAVGILVDRDSRQPITEIDACATEGDPDVDSWETQDPEVMPTFRQFHHRQDGIVDVSCAEKANRALRAAGYTDAGAVVLEADDRRRLIFHLWLEAYNEPLLDFFGSA